ncbi:MAG: hypothetical protein IJ471_08675 [Eubacterium sp.]|nr:hypothetical protein [Eubacterium sp.]
MKGKLMRKGVISLLLVVVLVMSSMTAFAADTAKQMSSTEFLALAENGTIELTEDIELTDKVEIRSDLTIDGNGYTISTPSTIKKTFEVYTSDVTFKDVTIENTYYDGRCIDTRTDDIALTLSGVTLKATGDASQPLTVGGSDPGTVTIDITDSTIETTSTGYAIIMWVPTNMTIDNSSITGWTTLYFKGAANSADTTGSVVTVKNSTLTGKNIIDETTSNNFGTVVFEDSGITLNIENSKVTSEATSTAAQIMFGMASGVTDNTINVSGMSELVVKGDNAVIGNEKDINNDIIIESATSNVEIPEEFISESTTVEKDPETGEYYVAIELTMTILVDGKEIEDGSYTVSAPKGYVFTEDDIKELNGLKEDLSDETLTLVGFYWDKDGKDAIVAGDTLTGDATLYVIAKTVDETPAPTPTPDTNTPGTGTTSPDTGDVSPVGLYVVILAAAVVAVGGFRMRKVVR